MLRNLKAEMIRKDLSRKTIADFLNIRYATVVDKLNGKYEFKLSEAIKIKERFFPNMSLEYLFSTDNKSKQREQVG